MYSQSFSNANWHLISIKDPLLLEGQSIFDVIKIMLTCMEFKFIILDAIEAVGQLSWFSMSANENKIFEINEILDTICKVGQFIWGDFFLFKNYPIAWKNIKGDPYPYAIEQTDT